MRKHISLGIVAVALTVGMLWPSEANAQFRPRAGVQTLGGFNRPMNAPSPMRVNPGVTNFSQITPTNNWNYNQYRPFFRTFGYNNNYNYSSMMPYYYYPSYPMYNYYGNGYYFPY
jgi:hypothetical protein